MTPGLTCNSCALRRQLVRRSATWTVLSNATFGWSTPVTHLTHAGGLTSCLIWTSGTPVWSRPGTVIVVVSSSTKPGSGGLLLWRKSVVFGRRRKVRDETNRVMVWFSEVNWGGCLEVFAVVWSFLGKLFLYWSRNSEWYMLFCRTLWHEAMCADGVLLHLVGKHKIWQNARYDLCNCCDQSALSCPDTTNRNYGSVALVEFR